MTFDQQLSKSALYETWSETWSHKCATSQLLHSYILVAKTFFAQLAFLLKTAKLIHRHNPSHMSDFPPLTGYSFFEQDFPPREQLWAFLCGCGRIGNVECASWFSSPLASMTSESLATLAQQNDYVNARAGHLLERCTKFALGCAIQLPGHGGEFTQPKFFAHLYCL